MRGDGRINKVLTAVRMFLAHAVANKDAPAWVLEQVYELGDDRDLPVEARGESGGLRYRLRARHRLQEPESDVDRASDEEVVATFRSCRSERDRLTLLLLARVGLRPGQTAGLHRSDLHLMADSRSLGCDIEGAHVHVVRRQNENNAWSKSKKSWAMPVDFLVVRAFDLYAVERHAVLEAGGSDFRLGSVRAGQLVGLPRSLPGLGLPPVARRIMGAGKQRGQEVRQKRIVSQTAEPRLGKKGDACRTSTRSGLQTASASHGVRDQLRNGQASSPVRSRELSLPRRPQPAKLPYVTNQISPGQTPWRPFLHLISLGRNLRGRRRLPLEPPTSFHASIGPGPALR